MHSDTECRIIQRMSLRHLAREIVIQALFSWDFYEKDASRSDDVFSFALAERDQLHDVDFPKELFNGVIRKVDVLDDIIEKAAPAWPIDRIAPVDRNILRVGIYEMLFSGRADVPPRVAINEAIELAKTYGGPNSYKFVSGVLGSIYEASDLKEKEQAKKALDPKNFPVSKKGGAIVYSVNEGGDIMLGLVHDIFGKWTLSKGGVDDDPSIEEGTARVVLDEMGATVEIEQKIGENEYLANDKEHGKIRKQVTYFVAKSPFEPLKVSEEKSGLTDAQWFSLDEIKDLPMYDDITPIVKKAVTQIKKNLK